MWNEVSDIWKTAFNEAWTAFISGSTPIGAVLCDEEGKIIHVAFAVTVAVTVGDEINGFHIIHILGREIQPCSVGVHAGAFLLGEEPDGAVLVDAKGQIRVAGGAGLSGHIFTHDGLV